MNELLELKAEVAALRAELTDIKQNGIRKSIPPPIEPATTVTYVAPAPVSEALLPDGKELQALRALCAREYPKFCDSDGYVSGRRGTVSKEENDFEYLLQFGRAILALSNMRKLPKPDTKLYAGDFVDHAKTVLRSIGKYTSELRSAPFFMACFVMGVPISGLGVAQCVPSLGLTRFDGIGSPIDPGSWRSVLKADRLPAQHRVERIIEQPSPVRIYAPEY